MCFNKAIFKDALNNKLVSNIIQAIKNMYSQVEQQKINFES